MRATGLLLLLSNSLAAFVHQRPPCARAPLLRPGTSLQGGDRRCLVVAQDIEEPGDDRFGKNLLGDALQMVLKSMGMGRDDVAEEVWAARQTLEEESEARGGGFDVPCSGLPTRHRCSR